MSSSSDASVDALAGAVSAVTVAAPAEDSAPRFHDTLDKTEVLDFVVSGPDALVPEQPTSLVVGSWEELPLKPELVRGVRNQGWEKPSPPQAWMLPYMLHACVAGCAGAAARRARPALLCACGARRRPPLPLPARRCAGRARTCSASPKTAAARRAPLAWRC